jgi:hypothetical protein
MQIFVFRPRPGKSGPCATCYQYPPYRGACIWVLLVWLGYRQCCVRGHVRNIWETSTIFESAVSTSGVFLFYGSWPRSAEIMVTRCKSEGCGRSVRTQLLVSSCRYTVCTVVTAGNSQYTPIQLANLRDLIDQSSATELNSIVISRSASTTVLWMCSVLSYRLRHGLSLHL